MGDVTPGFLVLLIAFCIAILSVKKDKILVVIIVAMCFLPADLSIKIANLNFTALRILALFGIAKLIFDPDRIPLEINQIDILFYLYHIVGSIAYIVASKNLFGAIVYKSGVAVDSIVLYTVFRYIIRSTDDLRLLIKTLQICVIILLPFIIFEYFSAYNLFSFVGRERISMRAGEIRAGGTFSHPILFGSFAAAIFPVLVADFINEKNVWKLFSIFCCLFFVISSSSSGPIIALAGAIFFMIFFKWKEHGSKLAWSILIGAIIIHLVREQPIWHFIYVRIHLKASSTGYHRYLLVNAAVKEFWNWWLFGYGDLDPGWYLKYWPWTHAKFTDVTNQYLLEGVRGGFFTMAMFIILCYKTVKTIGKFAIAQADETDQLLLWAFMVMMITHCISFLSVAYFGQIKMLLFLTIAVAAYAYNEMPEEEE